MVTQWSGAKPEALSCYGELRDIWPSYHTFQIANNKGADQTVRMRRLVCAFVVCHQKSQGFSRQGLYDVESQASWPPPGYAPDGYCVVCAINHLL